MARRFMRVGACANELSLMGSERDEVLADVGRAGGGESSVGRKSSRACSPPAIERMWRDPSWGGVNWTMQFVESGGRMWERRFTFVGRLAATKGGKSC